MKLKKKSNNKPKITIIQNNTVNSNYCWCFGLVYIQEANERVTKTTGEPIIVDVF